MCNYKNKNIADWKNKISSKFGSETDDNKSNMSHSIINDDISSKECTVRRKDVNEVIKMVYYVKIKEYMWLDSVIPIISDIVCLYIQLFWYIILNKNEVVHIKVIWDLQITNLKV